MICLVFFVVCFCILHLHALKVKGSGLGCTLMTVNVWGDDQDFSRPGAPNHAGRGLFPLVFSLISDIPNLSG